MIKSIQEAIEKILQEAKQDLTEGQYVDLLENVGEMVNDLLDKADEDDDIDYSDNDFDDE